jgi:hypothetical protein
LVALMKSVFDLLELFPQDLPLPTPTVEHNAPVTFAGLLDALHRDVERDKLLFCLLVMPSVICPSRIA